MKRREVLGLVVLGPLQGQAAWRPQILSEEQNQTVDVLSELILPRTDTPGAHDAQVNRYIDLMLQEGLEPADRARFLEGLAWFEQHCRQEHGVSFTALDRTRQTAMLGTMSTAAADTPARRFFGQMKDLTLRGYYTSRQGLLEELEYKGNGAFTEYPGCTHPEHRK
jgi:glucoside 3-dehydrogenase (cytochrome c) hitch-hiker subunit